VTRNTGQISAVHAVVGSLAFLAVGAGIVLGLDLLIQRDGRLPSLPAPAQDAGEQCPVPLGAGAAPIAVGAAELIECPDTFDGATVRYQGEAVRAVLPRGARAWLQLNDDHYALELGPLHEHRTAVGGNSGIAVSVPAAVADGVTHVGDARHRGDVLAVVGVFRRADPDDGGGPTIQAGSARIVRPGAHTVRAVSRPRMITAGVLSAAAFAAAMIVRLRSRPTR
jgi:hypothetical protein